MIRAATDRDGVLLEVAPTGCRLARVDEFGVRMGDPAAPLVRLAGDATEAPQKVECRAFPDQDALVAPRQPQHHAGFFEENTIPHAGHRFDPQLGIDLAEDLFGDRQAADDEGFTCFDPRFPALIGAHGQLRRDVPGPDVLAKRPLDEVVPALRRRQCDLSGRGGKIGGGRHRAIGLRKEEPEVYRTRSR